MTERQYLHFLLSGGGLGLLCCTGQNPNCSFLNLINFVTSWVRFYHFTKLVDNSFPSGGSLLLGVEVKEWAGRQRWIMVKIMDALWVFIKAPDHQDLYGWGDVVQYMFIRTFSSASIIFLSRFSVRRKTHGQCWRERLLHKRGFSRSRLTTVTFYQLKIYLSNIFAQACLVHKPWNWSFKWAQFAPLSSLPLTTINRLIWNSLFILSVTIRFPYICSSDQKFKLLTF